VRVQVNYDLIWNVVICIANVPIYALWKNKNRQKINDGAATVIERILLSYPNCILYLFKVTFNIYDTIKIIYNNYPKTIFLKLKLIKSI